MITKQSVFIAATLDGFIARPNGDLDWLTGNGTGSEEEDFGYRKFMDLVDALVVGRHTFEKVLTFGSWPYSKRVIVLSSRSPQMPDYLSNDVRVLSGSLQNVVDQLSEEGLNHLYIDGGKTIQRFLNSGLIQEMTVTRIPVLIGDGIPLFGPVKNDIKLHHVATNTYENGFVQSRYKIDHNA